ncbi:MAG: anthranilate phosphoribosyltransferase [Bacillota bacterium]|nr:anthranilate phosphoribosyltransferase [Bacillota bacterium]
MLVDSLKKVVAKENLSSMEAEQCMNEIMTGKCSPSQIGAFLIAMRMKGETIDEIAGCARAMKGNAEAFNLRDTAVYAIDTCGTGGDGGRTFNISTSVALVTAAAGVKVAKHGNRAVSSKSGSADVLREIGVNIEMTPNQSNICLMETGMTFLFAPVYHKAMKNAAGVRAELGMRTIFNVLGPLTNPADIKGQVLGVFDGSLTHSLAEVLLRLGRERAMVVHGNDGLDEITTTTMTKVSEVKEGKILDYYINPEDYNITLAALEDIAGGTPKENAEILLDILQGKKGAKRDIVLLNSAAALCVGKAVHNLKDGMEYAAHLIDSGKALSKLSEIIEFSRRVTA